MRDSNVLIRVVLSQLRRADVAVLSELQRKFPGLSRSALKVLFREKRIRLLRAPGEHIRTLSASDDLFVGTHLVEIQDWEPSTDLAPEPVHGPDTPSFPVLFEDDDLLILHKSAGIPSVPLKPEETKTAVSAAIRHFEKCAPPEQLKSFLEIGKTSGHPLEAGLLHRLDTGTSGVLAFAKNQAEFDRVRSLWKTPKVRKFYRAIAQVGPSIDLEKLPTRITKAIGHDPKSAKRMKVIQTAKDERTTRGKPLEAITHILKAVPLTEVPAKDGRFLDLRIEIETGVMHQIRVHLASIGLPIWGDLLYGKPDETSTLFAPRLHLHHERLELPLLSGTILSVQANWDFQPPASADLATPRSG